MGEGECRESRACGEEDEKRLNDVDIAECDVATLSLIYMADNDDVWYESCLKTVAQSWHLFGFPHL